MLFHQSNLPYWLFLGMGVLLFVFVIMAGGQDEDIDIDADVDLDADLEVDVDIDTSIDGDFGAMEILGWLGIGRAPLILLLATDLSLWGVLGWMLNVEVGSRLGRVPGTWSGGVVLVSSMLIALFGGSLIARPLGKVFAAFGEDASSDRLLGCIGTVSSAFIPVENQGRIGQVDVIDATHNLVTISAISPKWATVSLHRGEKVVVIDRHSQVYLVIAANSPDRDYWLEIYSKSKIPTKR